MFRNLTDRTKAAFIERNAQMTIRTLKRIVALVMLALLTLAVLLPAVSAGARPTRNSPHDFAAIDASIEAQMRDARIPGLALGIVQGDQIVHLKGFGVAGPDGREVTPQTPFQLASLGKPMTGVAIMQLVEAGKLELDAPVQRYLPWFRVADAAASAQITVRHLLYHTSGLPGKAGIEYAFSGDPRPDPLEERVRALRAVSLNRPVGASYEYSNVGYMILGLLIQQVSGQPYAHYMRVHVFAPLQMGQAFLEWTDAKAHGAASGYRYWFGIPMPGEMAIDHAMLPAGAHLAGSAEDVAHFMIAQLNAGRFGTTSILSPQGIAEMQRPIGPQGDSFFYAMDWGVRPIGGVPAVMKGGDNADFKTQIILFPEQRLGLVVLMNTNNLWGSHLGDLRIPAVAVNAAELLVGQPPTVFPVSRTPTLFLGVLLFAVAVQAAGMARTGLLLRRWHCRLEQRPQGWRAVAVRMGLPLVCNVVWGLVALVGVPMLFGLPLSYVRYAAPDFGAILVASGVIALGWSILRSALAFWVLRKPGATRAIGAPVTA
jgi:CubicO group peptidase (beta-lactamase class C family)